LAKQPELRGHAFNFSNEIQVTVLDLVRKIQVLMGSDVPPDVRNESSNEIKHQYLSAQKARDVLQWRPLFSLDEGLRRTIDWYREFVDVA
jgi:CDP-glucose 4,6-dehydratase